ERQNLINQYMQYDQYQQYFGMDMSTQLQQIQFQLNSPAILGQAVLDQMIDEEIIRQEAAKRGITVSEEELQETIRSAYSYYPNGTAAPTITPTAFNTPEMPIEALLVITPTLPPTSTPLPTATSLDSTPEPTLTSTATDAPLPTVTVGPTSTPFPTATPY